MRRYALLAYVGVVGLLVACFFALPGLRMLTLAGVGLCTVITMGLRVAGDRPPRWPGWSLIAVAVGLMNAGHVANVEEVASAAQHAGFPRASAVLFLLAYIPLAVGLLWLGQPRLPTRATPMLLDTAVLSLAGSLLVWVAVVRPALTTVELTTAGVLVVVGSWVGYVAVLAAAIRVTLTWRGNASLVLVAVAVASFLIGVVARGVEVLDGVFRTGTAADLNFIAFVGLCGVAVLTPSSDLIATARFARPAVPGPSRLALLAVGMLVAPTVLLAQVAGGSVGAAASIAIVMAVASIIVVLRLSQSVAMNRRRARAESVLQTAARSFLLATSEDEVVRILLGAVSGIVPGADVRVVGRHERQIRDEETTLVPLPRAARGERLGELVIPASIDDSLADEPGPAGTADGLATPPRAVRVIAPMTALIEAAAMLRTVADEAALAWHRIALTSRLQAGERERYFRTLVLTSDDVTLIIRDGRVAYATPSAQAMFGRNVVGATMADLVQEPPEGTRAAPSPATVDGTTTREAMVRRDDRVSIVLVRTRDLSDDPSVRGTVATLRDVTAEWRLRGELAHRASHDPLTGLANARLFQDELTAAADGADGFGVAVLYVDIDNFKRVNDTHGHDAGDRLLIDVARNIRLVLGPTDLAARLGGDEFAVLLRRVPDAESAGRIAARITDALRTEIVVGQRTLVATASVGVAFTDRPADPVTLTRQADAALYAAKAAGRGLWRVYGGTTAAAKTEA